jgi:hypothetical protein
VLAAIPCEFEHQPVHAEGGRLGELNAGRATWLSHVSANWHGAGRRAGVCRVAVVHEG